MGANLKTALVVLAVVFTVVSFFTALPIGVGVLCLCGAMLVS
jgi:hypothetical protein